MQLHLQHHKSSSPTLLPPAMCHRFPYVASARSSSPMRRLVAFHSRASCCILLRLCDTRHTSQSVFSYPDGLYDEGDEERRSALSRTMQSTGAYCRYVIGFAFASRLVPKSINHASRPPMLPHDDLPDGSPPCPLDPRVKHRAPLGSTW